MESSFFDCLQEYFFLDVYESQREEGYSVFSRLSKCQHDLLFNLS